VAPRWRRQRRGVTRASGRDLEPRPIYNVIAEPATDPRPLMIGGARIGPHVGDALVTSGYALREQHGRLREGAHGQQPSSTQPGPCSLIKTRRWPRSRLEAKKAAQRRRMQYLGRAAGLVAPPGPTHWWQHHVAVESSLQTGWRLKGAEAFVRR
jgi:hypothetical protein